MFRLNCLKLISIFKDDVTDILRSQFKKYIQNRYQSRWEDDETSGVDFEKMERFRSKLSNESIELLKCGDTSKWDLTLLTHAILYSSHILLGIPNPEDKKIEAYLTRDDCVLRFYTTDFTAYFKTGDRILCSCDYSLHTNFVKYIRRCEIVLRHPPNVDSQQVSVYACYSDWKQINQLRLCRNDDAHDPLAKVDSGKLSSIAGKVEKIYRALEIEDCRIQSMKDILKGMIACFKTIQAD